MENDSLAYVAGKFYNPFQLDSDKDILIIHTPTGEARLKQDLIMLSRKNVAIRWPYVLIITILCSKQIKYNLMEADNMKIYLVDDNTKTLNTCKSDDVVVIQTSSCDYLISIENLMWVINKYGNHWNKLEDDIISS